MLRLTDQPALDSLSRLFPGGFGNAELLAEACLVSMGLIPSRHCPGLQRSLRRRSIRLATRIKSPSCPFASIRGPSPSFIPKN